MLAVAGGGGMSATWREGGNCDTDVDIGGVGIVDGDKALSRERKNKFECNCNGKQ